MAVTLGAAVCAKPLHLLCQRLKGLHNLAPALTTSHKSCDCTLTLDVTHTALTGCKTPDMIHHTVNVIQWSCQLPWTELSSCLSKTPLREPVISAAALTSNAPVLRC